MQRNWKNADLVTELIWAWKERDESKITPIFLTVQYDLIRVPAISEEKSLGMFLVSDYLRLASLLFHVHK